MKVTRVAVALAVALPLACAESESPTAPQSPQSDPAAESPVVASVTGTIPIVIDVRPASITDRIPLNAGGVLPVVLLGTDAFDVSSVDAATLQFGPAGGPFTDPIHDLGVDGVLADHLKDVNLDGHLDLVTHYRIADLGFEATDEAGCLVGYGLGGEVLEGCAEVVTRP